MGDRAGRAPVAGQRGDVVVAYALLGLAGLVRVTWDTDWSLGLLALAFAAAWWGTRHIDPGGEGHGDE